MERIESHASFGGTQEVWKHASSTLHCSMQFGIYLPEQAKTKACPVLYWLSGLTCTEQNFITKAGAQSFANEHGLIVVTPDTSPRGADVADDASYALGQGAGFYLNATQAPWQAHYQMYDYIVYELPTVIEAHFPATSARSISGHSMGGHGALMCALKNPGRYRSVSAFAPISSLIHSSWGECILTAYLGADRSNWRDWDVCALIENAPERLPLLIEQGKNDEFLTTSLKPHLLQAACAQAGHPLKLNLHENYDHSYYFVASFIGKHLAYHAQALSP